MKVIWFMGYLIPISSLYKSSSTTFQHLAEGLRGFMPYSRLFDLK